MEYTFILTGHPNITSKHKTTLELTKDIEIGKTADCIIGVGSKISMENIPKEILNAIKKEETIILLRLETENGFDEIKGYGHPELTLDHPTDMVTRKSTFKCSRTLMINADKAAYDINNKLIEDLKKSKDLKVTIII
ncbi:MAG: DUF371 domain-containing protein [Methanobacterium sp.]|nr:DUF371 domain-containing protein [Methanobacterium sp.]